MRLDDTPFVLIDDARPGGGARLYRRPVGIVRADTPEDVSPALAALKAVRAAGRHAAGFVAYEAGGALEPKLGRLAHRRGDGPLLWFGAFDDCQPLDAGAVAALLPDPAGAWVGSAVPGITRADYQAAFEDVQALIAAGDLYQANLTFRAAVPVAGDPLALYAAIRLRAAAGHGALAWTGEEWLLSFSPELFFAVAGDTVTARPMKGTARRGVTAETDRRLADALCSDAKQRAENLMIVDLMRNDLTRVTAPGSVSVPRLFEIETFPTIHQMTSTVTARMSEERDAVDVLATLFPCGSVTGAPKIRAMEVIAAVEASRRGVYTGAIGDLRANGDAAFNVAIRTLVLKPGAERASIGLGSGIVADSAGEDEWQECLAKGAFLTAGQRRFDLVETMAFDPDRGLPLLDRHLARMKASAETFGFAFDRHAARNELQAATFRLRRASRVRLALARSGAVAISVTSAPAPPDHPVTVALVPLPVHSGDVRLRHKTSDRRFYDTARDRAGTFETVFVDDSGRLTEGSFTNLFVERGDRLLTPPLARGLLPGVLRAELIDSGRAAEHDLTAADLAGGFLIGNALRGLMPAVAVAKEAPR